ncbi:MAG TPA: hypothetical protein VFT16_01050 [Candidatus Saccharimonadales bacterium]|nr:hypothetical protein [Candidatus Saccharimonadales bacterium]
MFDLSREVDSEYPGLTDTGRDTSGIDTGYAANLIAASGDSTHPDVDDSWPEEGCVVLADGTELPIEPTSGSDTPTPPVPPRKPPTGGGDTPSDSPEEPEDHHESGEVPDLTPGDVGRTALTNQVSGPSDSEPTPSTKEKFTVVEFGSGRDPVISYYDTAPDIVRLYSAGGKYIGVDASAYNLERGQRSSMRLTEESQEGAEVTTEFRQGTILPEAPLPETVEPDSADRVIIKNVLTNQPIAIDPDATAAIAEAARAAVRKEPAGEVVVVGTLTADEYPAAAVIELFTAHGFEHVGTDDVGLYLPPGWKKYVEVSAYAERFRIEPSQQQDRQD